MFWLFSTKPRKTVYANCLECKVHLFTRRLFRFVSKFHVFTLIIIRPFDAVNLYVSAPFVFSGVFMFGAVIVGIFTDSIKLITGYQRPYFFNVCLPNFTSCPNYPSIPFEHPQKERDPRSVCSVNALESDLRLAW